MVEEDDDELDADEFFLDDFIDELREGVGLDEQLDKVVTKPTIIIAPTIISQNCPVVSARVMGLLPQ